MGCLAMATGHFEAAELPQADRVVNDARELRLALEELLAPAGG